MPPISPTVALLVAGILFSLLKGLDYEEAIVLTLMLCALLPCRKYFYRKASILSQRFTPGWIAAIAIVLLCSYWLVMFTYKHVEYSGDLWWRFTFSGDAPRSLRAMVGVFAVVCIFASIRLLTPAPRIRELDFSTDPETIDAIVRSSPSTNANLALLGDKRFLINDRGTAFIMFGVEGRSWVSMGNPVGPEDEWTELVWRFREICDRYDGWPVFHEIDAKHLPLYLDLGLTLQKLGEEARVPLESFSLEGSDRKGLRYTVRKTEKEGCVRSRSSPKRPCRLLSTN